MEHRSSSMSLLVSAIFISTLVLQLVEACSTRFSSPNSYWNQVFPNTPMPRTIEELLPARGFSGLSFTPSYIWKNDKQVKRPYVRYWANYNPRTAVLLKAYNHTKHRPPTSIPLFFLKDKLQAGSSMNFTLKNPLQSQGQNSRRFLPREDAESIPFSTSNLNDILKKLSIKPTSHEASIVRVTIQICERDAFEGEAKACPLSLDSMIDFAVSALETSKIRVLDNTVTKKRKKMKPAIYRIHPDGAKLISFKTVACHNLEYPYALFYCHKIRKTRSYMVPLVGNDGSEINAVAVCHFDTSTWHPMHESFQILGVKPGTVPICHFLMEGFAWVPEVVVEEP